MSDRLDIRMKLEISAPLEYSTSFGSLPFRTLFKAHGRESIYLKISDGGHPRAIRIDTAQTAGFTEDTRCFPVHGTITVTGWA